MKKNKSIVLKRIEDNYTKDYINKNKDEYFTAFSDAVENKEIVFDNDILLIFFILIIINFY